MERIVGRVVCEVARLQVAGWTLGIFLVLDNLPLTSFLIIRVPGRSRLGATFVLVWRENPSRVPGAIGTVPPQCRLPLTIPSSMTMTPAVGGLLGLRTQLGSGD